MPAMLLLHGLIALAISGCVSAQSAEELANLELYWSYGRSPPVYPPPITSGTGDWSAAYGQATALVGQMTNEEKQNVTRGYYGAPNGCSGNTGGVPRLNYPGLCLNDAGNGLRGTDGTNGYPSGIHVGAAWNRDLAYLRMYTWEQSFELKAPTWPWGLWCLHWAGMPLVAEIGKVGFTVDPYLAGQLVFETIRGMQQSTIACVKHFIANEQETNRQPIGVNASISSNLDDKTMHELYLWPFQDALHAGAGAVMCSYNRINGSNACQNSKTLNGLLKTELGFQGPVVSDWFGQYSGMATANSGLDIAMPDAPFWAGNNLTQGVSNGTLSQARLDDMATRILAAWYRFAPIENPGFGIPTSLLTPHEFVDARDPASKSTIFQGAVEGHVLVKNVNGTLPLRAPKVLSLFGYDAVAPLQNDWPPSGYGKWTNGWESVNANDTDVLTVFTIPQVYQFDPNRPESALNGTIISGGGSGAVSPAYINAPFEAIQQQAYQDGTWLTWDFYSQNPVVEAASDACLVFVNEFATEGEDRVGLADPYSDSVIENVAANCSNTIVVIHNAGIRLVDAWIDNPNITAVIFGHLPGQDSGRALVEVLYGYQSPSGRLPYTVAKQASDYGTLLAPAVPDNTSDHYTQSNFTEGIYIDYKAFIAANITSRYEFGYGLTYTTFSYSNLTTTLRPSVPTPLTPPSAPTTQGGNPTLFDVIATVSCTVTNTGTYLAAEVAQLYIGVPTGSDGEEQPEKVLRGFSKQSMDPGNSVTMEFNLTRRDLSVWDVVSQEWVLRRGEYRVMVGASVLDIRLEGTLTIQ